jgi:hypothetical protein
VLISHQEPCSCALCAYGCQQRLRAACACAACACACACAHRTSKNPRAPPGAGGPGSCRPGARAGSPPHSSCRCLCVDIPRPPVRFLLPAGYMPTPAPPRLASSLRGRTVVQTGAVQGCPPLPPASPLLLLPALYCRPPLPVTIIGGIDAKRLGRVAKSNTTTDKNEVRSPPRVLPCSGNSQNHP